MCKEFHPPTGVTLCAAAYLTHLPRKSGVLVPPDLVICKGKQLEIYSVRYKTSAEGKLDFDACGLDIIGQYQLFGVPEDISVLKSRAGGKLRDAIVLTFREAKVSVLEWDHLTHNLRTSSLHYYEDDMALRESRTTFVYPPRVVTDPQGRCAAVALYSHHLALLPARDSDILEAVLGEQGPQGANSSARLTTSYPVNLTRMGIQEVRDLTFLYNYTEPVLMVLHEPTPAWAGRYRERHDTCVATAISINLQRKRHPVIWSIKDLPSDSFRVVAVPRGGALVLSKNMIIYCTQAASHAVLVNQRAVPGAAPPVVDLGDSKESATLAIQNHANAFALTVHPDAVASLAKSAPYAPGIDVELDGAHVSWLTGNSCLLGVKTGELLLVQLSTQGAAKGSDVIKVTPSGGAPVMSCAVPLSNQLMFLGSWTGDSLLVRYYQEGAEPEPGALGQEDALKAELDLALRPAKKPRMMGDMDAMELFQEEEDQFPGFSSLGASGRHANGRPEEGSTEGSGGRYVLKVLDSLKGLATIRDLVVSEHLAPVKLDEAGEETPRGGPQLVAAVGYSKGGALAIMRRGVVGDIITEVPLPGVNGLWSLHYKGPKQKPGQDQEASIKDEEDEDQEGEGPAGGRYHDFLLLSVDGDRTMVLETGEELEEVTESVEYITDQPTLAAGELFDCQLLCQVCPRAVRLMRGSVKTQEWTCEALCLALLQMDEQEAREGERRITEAPKAVIINASISDPYVALHLSNGMALVLEGDHATLELAVNLHCYSPLVRKATESPQHLMTAVSLYKDHCMWLRDAIRWEVPLHEADFGPAPQPKVKKARSQDGGLTTSTATLLGEADDLEIDLELDNVGLEDADAMEDPYLPGAPHASSSLPQGVARGSVRVARTFCVVCHKGGMMEIYLLPECQVIFRCQEFLSGAHVLIHNSAPLEASETQAESSAEDILQEVAEVRLDCFPSPQLPLMDAPVLLALMADGNLLAYKAFHPGGNFLRFRRLNIDWVGHDAPAPGSGQGSRMVRYHNVGQVPSYSGVFISGERPIWLVASRNTLVAHPMTVEGPVAAMTPFHNVNCEQGYILSVSSGQLKICQLLPRMSLDTPWVTQKIPLRGTPMRVAWWQEKKLYAVLVAKTSPYMPHLPEEYGSDPHASAAYHASDLFSKSINRSEIHELRMIDPMSWNTVYSYSFPPGEWGLSVKTMHLTNTTTKSIQSFIVVGTSQVHGEDYPCLGRVVLFELTKQDVDVVDGVALQKWEGRFVYSREYQGPVTSVTEFKGNLLTAISSRLELHYWTGKSLIKSSFFDAPLFITSVNVVKDFILLGDVHKSVYFLRYVEAGRQLKQLGKDYDNLDVAVTDFLINKSKLNFLVADAAGTLRILLYDQQDVQSWKGRKLMLKGVFHVGHKPSKFMRLLLTSTEKRYAVMYSTLDGGLGLIWPLVGDEAARYNRLKEVQAVMTKMVVQMAGLNAKAFRHRYQKISPFLGGGETRSPPPPEQSILDGDLLWQFSHLDHQQQVAIASAASTTREQIWMDLQDMAAAVQFF